MSENFLRQAFFDEHHISPKLIVNLARSTTVRQNVISALSKFDLDDRELAMFNWFKYGVENYGANWPYIDSLTVLYAAAIILRPKNYLEIGVRGGRSCFVVVSACQSVNVFGFDLWIENYAGRPNPGPEFVRNQISSLGHTGELRLTTGNSQKTVPHFLRKNNIKFDLINVDGDHSPSGAFRDLKNVVDNLKEGGVIVFDDIAHLLLHHDLLNVWNNFIRRHSELTSFTYTELGRGVAIAVKRSLMPRRKGFIEKIKKCKKYVKTSLFRSRLYS